MPNIRKNLDINDLKRLYESGLSSIDIAKIYGVNAETIRKRLIENDVTLRNRKTAQALCGVKRRVSFDIDKAIGMYNSNIGVKAIAKEFGISDTVVKDRFIKAGIHIRNRSEGMYARMANTSPEEKLRLSSAAHNAVKGVSRSEEHLCAIANSRERNGSFISRTEVILREMLEARGFTCQAQKAVGRYNVDVAITEPPISVEVFGGGWHFVGDHAARFRKRTEYILNKGWTQVCVVVGTDYPLEVGAIEYIVSLAQALSLGKPIESREHVIFGNGNTTAIGQNKLNGITGVPSAQPRDDTTGRFKPRSR